MRGSVLIRKEIGSPARSSPANELPFSCASACWRRRTRVTGGHVISLLPGYRSSTRGTALLTIDRVMDSFTLDIAERPYFQCALTFVFHHPRSIADNWYSCLHPDRAHSFSFLAIFERVGELEGSEEANGRANVQRIEMVTKQKLLCHDRSSMTGVKSNVCIRVQGC